MTTMAILFMAFGWGIILALVGVTYYLSFFAEDSEEE